MSLLTSFQYWNAARGLRARRADFYYDLASALEDKVPLFTILKKHESRARKREPSSALLYQRILRESMGGSLSHALRGIVPNNELIMIDAVQSSGDASLASGLLFISDTVEKTDRMLGTVRKAVVYPSILFMLFATMLSMFSFFAVPVLEELLPPEKWPFIGKILYAISSAVRNYGLYMLLFMIVAAICFFHSLPRWRGTMRTRLDGFSPYSLYRDYSGAMLIVSLSSMMRTGVSLRSSLERAARFSTPWMRWHLRLILKGLASENATQFGQAFATGVLSPVMQDRVQDASERREPVNAFVKIGIGSLDRIERDIQSSAAKINVFMMAAAGVLLGLMMTGFFATAFELQSGIQAQATIGAAR